MRGRLCGPCDNDARRPALGVYRVAVMVYRAVSRTASFPTEDAARRGENNIGGTHGYLVWKTPNCVS
ncbi:hypothetical protein MRX96_036504 [Rhipicephalus microplus]